MGVREIVSELELGWVKEAISPRAGWENRVDRPMFNFYKAHKAEPRVPVTAVSKETRKATPSKAKGSRKATRKATPSKALDTPSKAMGTPTTGMGTPTRGGRGRK